MTDSGVQTKLVTLKNQKLDFQDYFVKKQGKPRLKKDNLSRFNRC